MTYNEIVLYFTVTLRSETRKLNVNHPGVSWDPFTGSHHECGFKFHKG